MKVWIQGCKYFNIFVLGLLRKIYFVHKHKMVKTKGIDYFLHRIKRINGDEEMHVIIVFS